MADLIILISGSLISFILGLLVLLRGHKGSNRVLFFLLILSLIGWSVANYISLGSTNQSTVLLSMRIVMFFAVLQAAFFMSFALTFPQQNIKISPTVKSVYVIAVLAALAVTLSPYLFSDVAIDFSTKTRTPTVERGMLLFVIVAVGSVLAGLINLIRKYIKNKGIEKQQISFLLAGIFVMFSLMIFFNLVLVVIFKIDSFVSLGPFYILPFIGSTAYAIVAHQLFDIRVIIKRTVVYSGLLGFTLATYSAVVFFFTAVFGGANAFDSKSFIPNLVAAILIAVGFEPLRRYLTKITDKYLFKGEYDPQAVLAQLSSELSNSVDIRQAAQSLVTLIKTQMRLSHAAVITFSEEGGRLVVKEPIQDGYDNPTVLQLPDNSFVLQQFSHAPQTLTTDTLKREYSQSESKDPSYVTYQKLIEELDALKVSISIPVSVNKKVIGVFMVGEKRSGDIFTREEVEFLTIVANQTANAIEKARFWEEDQMKSEFVSIASHELLTPTAAMKGYLSMILDDNMGQVDETARGFLTKVYESSNRLAVLVEDLLNVSRIESGRLKINKKAFSLVASVTKAVDELQVKAKEKSLDLAFVPPAGGAEGALPDVFADPDHVYRVLVNLIGNSIKYTPAGWVRCFVALNGEHMAFIIQDSGLGIPQEMIPHLFEKFYRADRKEISGIQGTGLGLYVSKKIVDLMGGELWVESQVGHGTTFYFTVPVAGTKAAEHTPTPAVSEPVGQDGTAKTSASEKSVVDHKSAPTHTHTNDQEKTTETQTAPEPAPAPAQIHA